MEASEREHTLLLKFARFRLTQKCAPRGEQGKIAGELGISQAHASNIVKGRARITDALLRRMMAVWGHTREQFVLEAEQWASERPQRKRKAS